MRMGRYILDELDQPIECEDLMEWTMWFEKTDRRIALTMLPDGKRVSTVFLALDHGFEAEGPPILYETMVFPPDSSDDLDCDRYSTKQEALEGHKRMVDKWTQGGANEETRVEPGVAGES
jgi:hypothetical protein